MPKLIYVVGASGSGKDSLLNYVRQHLALNSPVMIAHRYITRPAQAEGENHIALSEDEFHHRRKLGCFSMYWYSHNTWYGIGSEIDQWLAKGLSVIVNGSRTYLESARSLYPNLKPLLITAEEEVLKQRLISRGRESMPQIESRVSLAKKRDEQIDDPELFRLSNSGRLEDAGNQLINYLEEQIGSRPL